MCEIVKKNLPSIQIDDYHVKASIISFILFIVAKGSFYGRDNIFIFAKACQQLGIRNEDCISSYMFDNNQRKDIVNSLLRFAIYGSRYGLKKLNVLQSERLQTCKFCGLM